MFVIDVSGFPIVVFLLLEDYTRGMKDYETNKLFGVAWCAPSRQEINNFKRRYYWFDLQLCVIWYISEKF